MQEVAEGKDKKSEVHPTATPIGRKTIAEVDIALADCDKVIKSASDAVRSRLASNGSIPSQVLRELARANAQRSKLILRRIVLLIETGDASALEHIEKLLKVKPKAA